MNGSPHQVGLYQSASYTAGLLAMVEFDNFSLGRNLYAKASAPYPSNGGAMDLMKQDMQWTPGDLALDQKLYFGTNMAAVTAADDTNSVYRPTGIEGIGEPGPTGMYPKYRYANLADENVQLGKTYYWRVDEINGVDVWKGDTWKFTVNNYTRIDAFDQYGITGDVGGATTVLRRTWIDGLVGVAADTSFIWPYPNRPSPGGSSGSYAQVSTDVCDGNTLTANVYAGGNKSMKLYYENDGKVGWLISLYNQNPAYYWYDAPKYSEISAAVDDAARLNDASRLLVDTDQSSLGMLRDWGQYKLLKVSYYGDWSSTKTATDRFYVALIDSDNTKVVINCPDADAQLHQAWHTWYSRLKEFNSIDSNLDLSQIKRICFGVGNPTSPAPGGRGAIFIDEVQLLSDAVCAPVNPADVENTGVAYDWNYDCAVGAADLRMLTRNWLTESGGAATLPDANCILKLNASTLALGPGLNAWANTASGPVAAGGTFRDPCSTISGRRPTVQMVDGIKAVMFDANDILISDINAPASMAGTTANPVVTGQAPFTAVIKVWNEAVANDETIINWGKRGGPDGKYACLTLSPNNAWGAAAYWGGADTTFTVVPAVHQWHTITHIYTGGKNGKYYVIDDGRLDLSRTITLDIWPNCPMVLGGAYNENCYTTLRNKLGFDNSYKGTLAIAEIKFYNMAIDPFTLIGAPNIKTGDVPEIIDFKDVAVFANSWMLGPVLLGD
jgi:hypothetical protein